MTTSKKCAICRNDFDVNERVIFSSKETFIFKPAHVKDTVNPATVSHAELAESRKDYMRTAIVNTFVDWGRCQIPDSAFHFRHQWCEPQRTGSAASLHPVNKHAIRFNRAAPGRLHG